jgi:hypothetical protein
MHFPERQNTLNLRVIDTYSLVLQDSQATLHNTVLQDGTRGNVNGAALGGDNDNGTLKSNVAAEVDGTGHGQVVQLDNAGNAGNALLEVGDLLEVGAELDNGDTAETVGVHDQLAVLETVQIGLDDHEIGAGLDGQEAATGHIDTVGVLEVTDGRTNGGLELVDGLIGLTLLVSGDGLLVGDDLHLELVLLHNTLDSADVHPDVVGVEVLELLDGLELVDVLLGDLGNLEQADLAVLVNDSTTLNISLGLVSQLHDVLGLGVNHVLKDAEIHDGTEVVGVGQENVLDATLDQLVESAGVVQGLENVTVTRGVPVLEGRVEALGGGKERVLDDTGVAGLVEGDDVNVVALVLLNDGLGVLVGVEGVHQDEGNVDVEAAVEVLDLANRQIQEGHALTDLDDGLGTDTAHGGTETTVELDDGELVQELNRGISTELVVADDLRGLGRSDALPVDSIALGLVVEEAAEQGEEVVHLGLEALLLGGVGDGVGEGIQRIAHLRGSDASGGILESLDRSG